MKSTHKGRGRVKSLVCAAIMLFATMLPLGPSADAADPVEIRIGATIDAGNSAGVSAAQRLAGVEVEVFLVEGQNDVASIGTGETKLTAPTADVELFATAEVGNNIIVCVGDVDGYSFAGPIVNLSPGDAADDPRGGRNCFSTTVFQVPTNTNNFIFDFEVESDIEVGTTADSEGLSSTDQVRLPGVDVEVFLVDGATATLIGSGPTTLTGNTQSVNDVFATAEPGSTIITCVADEPGYTFNAATSNPGTPAAHPNNASRHQLLPKHRQRLSHQPVPMFFDFEVESTIEVGTTADSEGEDSQDQVRLPGVDVEVFLVDGGIATLIWFGANNADW